MLFGIDIASRCYKELDRRDTVRAINCVVELARSHTTLPGLIVLKPGIAKTGIITLNPSFVYD